MDAGRNDQMMSVYLPYCDQFITAERKRMQEKCLSAIAIDAKIPAQIRSFDDFCNSFSVGRGLNSPGSFQEMRGSIR